MEHCLTTAQPSASAAKSHRRQAMSGRLLRAVRLLEEGGHTCVLCKDELVLTSGKRGVLPLIEWIEQGRNLKGFSAADKIVGLMYILLLYLLNKYKLNFHHFPNLHHQSNQYQD